MTPPARPRRRHAVFFALALGSLAPGALAQTAPSGGPPGAAPPVAKTLDGPAQAAGPSPARAPGASGAAAGPDDSAARGVELRRKGNRAWQEGRYADALAHYEESLKLSQEPKTYYNLAAAYEKVGRYPEALASFSRFKAEASPAELDEAPNLGSRIDALRKRVAVLKVRVNVPGARVLVRDSVVGTQPADRPLEVSLNEGKAPVEILHEGYKPYRKDYALQGGSSLELEVQLNREAPPVVVGEKTKTIYVTSTPFWSQWWFWAGAGALVLGGAVTVYALSTEKSPDKSTFGPGQYVTSGALGPSGLGVRF